MINLPVSKNLLVHDGPSESLIELTLQPTDIPHASTRTLLISLFQMTLERDVHNFSSRATRSDGPYSRPTINLLMANSALDKCPSSHHRWPVDAHDVTSDRRKLYG